MKKGLKRSTALFLSAALVCSLNAFDSALFQNDVVFSETGSKEKKPLSVSIDFKEKNVRSGSDISFRLDISGDAADDAWVAIVKSDTPHTEKDGDAVNGDYAYLKNIKDGNVTLHTPVETGNYDIRVYDGENSETSKEIAYQTFTLEYGLGLKASIELEENVVRPNTDLEIRLDTEGELTDDAWITFVPYYIPHTEKDGDEYNGSWMRLKDIENNTAVIRTPDATGPYDIRVYNGEDETMARELDYKTIILRNAPDLKVEADTEKRIFEPEEKISLKVKTSGEIPDDSWLTLIPSETPHTESDGDAVNIGCVWLKDIKDGTAVLSAPAEEGYYDIRVYNGDNEKTAEEIACIPVKVGSPSGYSVFFKTDSDILSTGADVKIYSGIMGEIPADSWVGFVPAETPDTAKDSFAAKSGVYMINEIKDGSFVISAPETEGKYELRAYSGTGSDSKRIFSLPVFFTDSENEASDDFSDRTDYSTYSVWGRDIPYAYMKGDVNLDHKISVTDLVILKKRILGVINRDQYSVNGRSGDDLDINGTVNVIDLSMMIRILLDIQTQTADDRNIKIADFPKSIPAGSITYAKLENVNFAKLGSDAWLGLIPADAGKTEKEADSVDICYSYISTVRDDNYIFLNVPEDTVPGNYELRIYQNDSGGELLTSEPVTVTEKMTFRFNSIEWGYDESSKQKSGVVFDISGTGFTDENFGIIAAVPAGTNHDTDSINLNMLFYWRTTDLLNFYNEVSLEEYTNEKIEFIALSDFWSGRILDSYTLPDM